MQSRLATGSPPGAVDPAKMPWAVIPPAFNAFRVTSEMKSVCEDDLFNDVVMSDLSAGCEKS